MGIDALVVERRLSDYADLPPKRTEQESHGDAKRVIKRDLEKIAILMRLKPKIGTARKAGVKGFIIRRTTAVPPKDKVIKRPRYAKKKRRCSPPSPRSCRLNNHKYQMPGHAGEQRQLKET